MIISEHIGFTRYVVSDVIMTAKVMECIGGEANFQARLPKVSADVTS
jgi:hypothetical protein